MATRTAGAAQTGVQPRAVHAGVNAVRGILSLGGTALSAGDVLQMVKVPHNAIIDSVELYASANTITGTGFAIGDGGNQSRYKATAQHSNVTGELIKATHNMGYQYTFSDNAVAKMDTIDIHVSVVSAAASSGYLDLGVTYHLP